MVTKQTGTQMSSDAHLHHQQSLHQHQHSHQQQHLQQQHQSSYTSQQQHQQQQLHHLNQPGLVMHPAPPVTHQLEQHQYNTPSLNHHHAHHHSELISAGTNLLTTVSHLQAANNNDSHQQSIANDYHQLQSGTTQTLQADTSHHHYDQAHSELPSATQQHHNQHHHHHHHYQQQQQQYYQHQFTLNQQQQQTNYSINGILGIEQQRHLESLHQRQGLGAGPVNDSCESPLDVVDSRIQMEGLKSNRGLNNMEEKQSCRRVTKKRSTELIMEANLNEESLSVKSVLDTTTKQLNNEDESNEAIDLEITGDSQQAGKYC